MGFYVAGGVYFEPKTGSVTVAKPVDPVVPDRPSIVKLEAVQAQRKTSLQVVRAELKKVNDHDSTYLVKLNTYQSHIKSAKQDRDAVRAEITAPRLETETKEDHQLYLEHLKKLDADLTATINGDDDGEIDGLHDLGKARYVTPAQLEKLTPSTTLVSLKSSVQASTDQSIVTAQVSKMTADKLQSKLGNQSPEDDPVGWKMYVARREVANQDQSKAEQAIAAEMRITYQADPANKEATINAAHDIALRYKDDPVAQNAVTKALNTVTHETATQRHTNIKLNETNQAATKLDSLTNRLGAGDKSVTPAKIAAARADYNAKQKELLTATKAELTEAQRNLPTRVVKENDDPLAFAANEMSARYAADNEFNTVIKAATILSRVDSASVGGNEAQLKALGDNLPKGVDPAVKGLVMSDEGAKKIVDIYVTDSAKQVDDSYNQNGTVAGAETLRDVTNPSKHAVVSPEIAARIINQSQPTIEKIVTDIANLQSRGKDGIIYGIDPMAGTKVANALSQSVDVAAAGSDWESHTYQSPAIKSAVENTARIIATHPAMDLAVTGMQDAVGHGYATLALETVNQVKQLNLGDVKLSEGMEDFANTQEKLDDMKGRWVSGTMGAIDQGLKDLKENNSKMLDDASKGMAPLLVQGKYSPVMTDQAFQNGEKAMVSNDPKLKQAVIDGRIAINDMGYRLVRTSEAVEFYRPQLEKLANYGKVDATRKNLMADEKVTTTVMASTDATRRMGVQVARKMLSDDMKNGGGQAQTYGIGAQALGDLTEFLAETYVIGKINNGVNLPGADIAATRAAHIPYFGGAAIWGIGGGLQAALTGYIVNNVEIGGPGGDLRKGILLGLVGGFAGFHLMQAGMAAVRIQPHSFGNGKAGQAADWLDVQINKVGVKYFDAAATGENSWGLYVKEGSARDRWTRLAVEATPGLIKQLVGLMTIATVWDASGVFMNASELSGNPRDNFKLATQGINLFNDTLLLRLQTREMSLRYLGQKVMSDPALKAVAEKRAMAEGVKLDLRLAGQYAMDESAVKGGATGTAKWLGSSKFLNVFEGVFGNKAFAAEAASAAEKISPALRSVLFKTVVGESGEAAAARFALLGDNPIGWVVNILYMATTLGNWAYDHNKNIAGFEKYDRTFLEGAGLQHGQAQVMDEHHWLSSDAKVDGFLKGYEAMNGDPSKFIDYINKLSPNQLDKALSASEQMDDRLNNGKVPEGNLFNDSYLALPPDPSKVDLQYATAIKYNEQTQRYEDAVTGMYYLEGSKVWRSEVNQNVMDYDPKTRKTIFYGAMGQFNLPIEVSTKQGWQNWMNANGISLPEPTPPVVPTKPETPPPPPVLTQNVYIVKEGDSVWKLAGNDSSLVKQIYDLNPWLNQRLEANHRAEGHGRNPNLIQPGEKIVVPERLTSQG